MILSYCGDDLEDSEMDGDGGEGQEDEGGEEVGSASEVESEENAG